MEKSKKETVPVYRKIAINIAQDVVSGKYFEGQKLSGRTVLSSQYRVSPETIRKAVYLLKDVGILDIEKNSGVLIRSVREAAKFIQQNRERQSVSEAKNELFAWMERQVSETAAAMEKMQFIINASERFKKSTPFVPYEVVVPPKPGVAGKSISDLNFWHMTGATIIAVERGDQTILSPGPYTSLLAGDILYIVGDEQALHATIRFVTTENDAG
ncbi:MAG TPA: TrkA C-terminal domain-containing protein [Clostridia bacterium]|nr:TrkA C-terminal domain-containing protein [Clostridia bacterium]